MFKQPKKKIKKEPVIKHMQSLDLSVEEKLLELIDKEQEASGRNRKLGKSVMINQLIKDL